MGNTEKNKTRENAPAGKEEENEKKEVKKKKSTRDENEEDDDFGGMPAHDLKKNLGCGG